MGFLFPNFAEESPFTNWTQIPWEGPKELLHAKDLHKNDDEASQLFKKVHTYYSARHDFQNLILAAQKMMEKSIELRDRRSPLDPMQADIQMDNYHRLMHCIVCYARWFLSTKNRSILDEGKIFPSTQRDKNLVTHTEIMTIRNEYIAHNQNDHLGEIRIWLLRNQDESISHIDSDYTKLVGLNPDALAQIIQSVQFGLGNLDALIEKASRPLVRKLKALEGK